MEIDTVDMLLSSIMLHCRSRAAVRNSTVIGQRALNKISRSEVDLGGVRVKSSHFCSVRSGKVISRDKSSECGYTKCHILCLSWETIHSQFPLALESSRIKAETSNQTSSITLFWNVSIPEMRSTSMPLPTQLRNTKNWTKTCDYFSIELLNEWKRQHSALCGFDLHKLQKRNLFRGSFHVLLSRRHRNSQKLASTRKLALFCINCISALSSFRHGNEHLSFIGAFIISS